MPIRFRCPHCQQLLGIAHRKAGRIVDCPTCHNQLLVPKASKEPEPEAPPAEAKSPALFERSDFDAVLRGPASPQPAPLPPPPPGGYDVEVLKPAPAGPGPLPPPAPIPSASTSTITVWVVVVLLTLGVAFAAGLLVGRFLL